MVTPPARGIAATDNGGLVVFWADDPSASILAQRYDAAGVKVGARFTVHDITTTETNHLQATRLADGRVSLTWVEVPHANNDRDSRFAIWDLRDATNAPDANGMVVGTRNNDVIAVAPGTKQVFAGKGEDSIARDITDLIGLTTLDGGRGTDKIRFAAQAGTFDLRTVWVAYNEELEFAGGANIARTVQLDALDVAFLGEVDFDATAGSAEKVVITMGSITQIDLGNVTITDQQAGLDSLVIKGDGSVETITGSSGSDTIEGRGGNDVLAGGKGNDTVEGGAGANTLRGNGGDDVLDGDAGADSVDGGAGNDTFWIDDGDIVAGDILYGGTGSNDDLQILANGGGIGLTTTNLRPATIANMDRLTFANVTGDSLVRMNAAQLGTILTVKGFGGLGIDETLEIFTDSLTSVSLSNLTFSIWDAAANLVKLTGAAGNDRLDGGTGADDFVFGTGSGADVVVLFEDGSDQVDLTGALTFAGLTLTAIAGGVRVAITATPTDMIDLMGVTLGQVTAGDFI